MSRAALGLSAAFLLIAASPLAAQQQPATPPAAQPAPPAAQPAPPLFATTKVEGTENVYIFRYQGHQAMFVVTPEGVIATDPIGLGRPQAVTTYIDEIRKVTSAPIRYVIYSHHHFDHIAGGKPFKDAGARFVSHKNAKDRIVEVNHPDVVVPDELVDDKRTITLGGTTLELVYVGRNHSDNSLVMHLPKEKLVFIVDWIPIQSVMWRNMPDSWPIEWEKGIDKVLTMDWDRMIPGHPGPGGRLGTKEDARDTLTFMRELSAEVKKAVAEGKCYDKAQQEVKLPKYSMWANYEQWLGMNVERYCHYWRVGL
jgi:glyoxylase-like metal-dependent hydrolase (beta-lactamase superfamily II)